MHNYHVSMYTELSSLLLAFYVPQAEPCATPLLTACDHNKVDVATYLIQQRANVNYKNKVINCLYCFHNLFTKQGFPHRMALHPSTLPVTMATLMWSDCYCNHKQTYRLKTM